MTLTQQQLSEAIKELKSLYLEAQIQNTDLAQRVYFLESYTGLGNGIMKPILSKSGVEQAKTQYILEGRQEMINQIMQTNFKSNLLDSL